MFQQIQLVGRLGSEPELRRTQSGKAVASFSLAVDKPTQGEKKTLWLRVSCWERDAENAAKYLTKGSTVLVIGEVEEPRVFTDRQGNQRASLDITARTVRFLGGKGERTEPVGNVTVDDAEALPF